MADLHGGGGMEDFQEEEVWAMIQGSNSNSKVRKSSSSSAWRFAATSRGIPRSSGGSLPHQSSAPVNIPDWSKILKKKPQKNDDEEDMLPPHEYIARRLASTQIASFSMCEGVGRTLKGRDLSNLRNAILTKTGFLE